MKNLKSKLLEKIYEVVKDCEKEVGIAYSSGVDSSLLTKVCLNLGKKVFLLTVGFKGSPDIERVKEYNFGLPVFIKELDKKDVEEGIKFLISRFEFPSLIDLEISLAFYFIFKLAKEKGIKTVLSANGLDELFCGYRKYKKILEKGRGELEEAIKSDIKKAREINERNRKIAKFFGVNFIEPFLDEKFVEFALKIPLEYKIKSPKDEIRKHLTREIAFELGVPKEIAFRKKKSMQYSSRIDKAIEKLAKEKGITKFKARKMGFLGVKEAYVKSLKNSS